MLGAFLGTGTAPSRTWLREQAVALGLDPGAALAELAGADLVHVSKDLVVVAYPLSGGPTNDRVQLEGVRPLWAMCAINALGILVMTGRDGVVTSADPQDNQPIHVERRGTRWYWRPDSTVVLVGAGKSCGHAAEIACPHMAFHAAPKGPRRTSGPTRTSAVLSSTMLSPSRLPSSSSVDPRRTRMTTAQRDRRGLWAVDAEVMRWGRPLRSGSVLVSRWAPRRRETASQQHGAIR